MGKIGSNATKQNLAAQTIQILVARIKKFTLIYEVEIINFFLVACYATLHPPMSICLSVGQSVGPFFTFLGFFYLLSSLLLPKCPSDLLYHCPCPPARD